MTDPNPWSTREKGLLKRALSLYENQLSLAVKCEPALADRGYDSCRSASRRLDSSVQEVKDLRIDNAPEAVYEQIQVLSSSPASRIKMPSVLSTDAPVVTEDDKGNKQVSYVGRRFSTEQEMRDAAGLSVEQWECKDFKIKNSQAMAKDEANPGNVIITNLYHVSAAFSPRKEYDVLADYKDGIIEEIAKHAPAYTRQWPVPDNDDPHMFEPSLYDLHVNKLVWGEEVNGDNFDSKLATDLALSAVDDSIKKVRGYNIEKIIMPVGHDLFNIDDEKNATTRGTLQDVDSRPGLMYARAEKLMIDVIDRYAMLAPVEVLVVPGNHDKQNSVWLGRVLNAWYRNTSRVNVDVSPPIRKYRRYGPALIGFTHGDNIKIGDLPLIMAREAAADWAQCDQFEWHIGHEHRKRERVYTIGDEFNGVRVRVLPSLTAFDQWHYSKGYVGTWRAMESLIWSKHTGYVGNFSSNVIKGRILG